MEKERQDDMAPLVQKRYLLIDLMANAELELNETDRQLTLMGYDFPERENINVGNQIPGQTSLELID